MPNTMTAVRHAWEAFMSDVPLRGSGIRPVVLASWKRSRAQQAPAQSHRTQVLDLRSIGQLSRQSHELLGVADPVFRHARKWLASSQSMLILCDVQGTVLRTTGDSRALRQGQEIGLQQGGLWREEDIGTNAIGTALAVNAPVRIHAFEHFCENVQTWSCAAAPIHDPHSARLLGVVDISSAALYANEQSLAYATVLVQQIHSQLLHHRQTQQQRLLQHLLEELPRWQGHHSIAFDPRGHLLHRSSGLDLRDTPLQARLDSHGELALLRELPPAQWPAALHSLWPQAQWHIVRESKSMAVSAGQHSGDCLGVWAALPMSSRRLGRAQAPSSAADAREPQENEAGRRTAPAILTPQPDELDGQDRLDALQNAFAGIVGHSPAMRETLRQAQHIARAGLPVLIQGETGTGKELFAQALHAASRPGKPFVPVNCGGLPHELISSEIFGYERGAFTGAAPGGRAGKVEAADGGTLCLDEIGEMPLSLQPYLLRVLEDRQVWRIGSHTSRSVDVRLLAMTNRDLEEEIRAGRFRQDLYYRIAVTRLHIPALRERAEDIPALVAHFAEKAAIKTLRSAPRFSPAAMARLQEYAWPGNIRELRNTIDMVLALHPYDCLGLEHLPEAIRQGASTAAENTPSDSALPEPGDLRQIEAELIHKTIAQCQGNLSAAAKKLGIARSTLYSRLRRNSNNY